MEDYDPEMHTYTDGFTLMPSRTITSTDLVNICKELTAYFNDKHKTTEYLLRPERICEGGIKWENWPGKSGRAYKSMRIRFDTRPHGNYPHIRDIDTFGDVPEILFDYPNQKEEKEEYRYKEEWECANTLTTFLKAFRSAPAWTYSELNVFQCVLHKHGLPVPKKYITWAKPFLRYQAQKLKQKERYEKFVQQKEYERKKINRQRIEKQDALKKLITNLKRVPFRTTPIDSYMDEMLATLKRSFAEVSST